jgi:hypothetical protein
MPSFELVEPIIGTVTNKWLPIGFHIFLAFCVFITLSVLLVYLTLTRTNTSSLPTGWAKMDYNALKGARKSLSDYLTDNQIPDSTPITQFAIATANFGGIFTEDMKLLEPWIGSVSADAAQLQVEAGARAMVFDIWPDPANMKMPVIASMVDSNEWSVANWWRNTGGLNKGTGRYSNWQRLSRNVGNVSEILTQTIATAFTASPSNQNEDPFFLILNLHGAMTTEYLNYLGSVVQKAVGGYSMSAEWGRANNQDKLCQTAISTLKSRVVVIVNPDIQPGFNALPNVSSIETFNVALLKTKLGEATNVLASKERPIVFDLPNISAIKAVSYPNCDSSNIAKQTLAQTGLVVIQPSIGGTSTDNDRFYRNDATYDTCMGTGAQMVAVNLLSHNDSDAILTEFFDDKNFGKYSFKRIAQ